MIGGTDLLRGCGRSDSVIRAVLKLWLEPASPSQLISIQSLADCVPWEKKYDETDVVVKAMHAFWAHGYGATSVNDLVRETGVNRGSLYAAFSGKRDLFLAALRYYDQQHRDRYLADLATTLPPKAAIVAAFEAAAQQTELADTPSGCLLVNTALEVSSHDREVRDLVKRALQEVEGFFFDMIGAARGAGTLQTVCEPRAMARALLGLFLGLRVLARSGTDRAVRDAVVAQAKAMLG